MKFYHQIKTLDTDFSKQSKRIFNLNLYEVQ